MAPPSDRSLDELIAELAQAKQRVRAIAHPSVLADLQAFDTFLRAVSDDPASGVV